MTKNRRSMLEEGLLTALHAIDQQIARAMERSPAEREKEGVQKWGPYTEKIEQVCSLMLSKTGEEEIHLDSLIVIAQASVKALKLITEELGPEGLGKVRSNYCQVAFEQIKRDARSGLIELHGLGESGLLT